MSVGTEGTHFLGVSLACVGTSVGVDEGKGVSASGVLVRVCVGSSLVGRSMVGSTTMGVSVSVSVEERLSGKAVVYTRPKHTRRTATMVCTMRCSKAGSQHKFELKAISMQ